MSLVPKYRNLLQSLDIRIKVDWNNKEQLSKHKEDISALKSKFGFFNGTAAFLGLALFHTFTIYSNKTTLVVMEKKAWNHIQKCIGIGLASGLAAGGVYGSSAINSRYSWRLENKISERLSQLK